MIIGNEEDCKPTGGNNSMAADGFVCLLHVYQASSVSKSPKQANATCPGQTITLMCKNSTADGMVWQINGKDVAVYFPLQKKPCQDTNPFPNGDVGRYCGWTSNDETSSNLTFTAKPEQDKWNVTCLGSDSTFNDTTMIMVAKRSPMAVMNIILNCPDRVLSWQTSPEDYVDNFTIQIGNTTYSTLNQSFKLHQLDVESTKQLQLSVWASNCQGNGPNLSECFCQCESCIHNSSCDQPNQYTKNVSIVWSTLSLLSLIICCIAMLKHLNVRRCSDLTLSSNWETTFIACLIVSEMLLLVVNFLQMFVYLTESNSSRWCYVFGFFYQFALDTIALLTFAIDIYLFMFARNKGVVKPIQFGFACALLMGLSYPLSIVPFVEDCYGDSGGWCWISIKAKRDCSCKVENLAFYQQIGIWYAKIFAALIAGIILLSPHIFKRVVGRSHGEKFTAVFGLYFISFFAANLSGVLNRSLTWYYGNPTKFFQILQVVAFTLWPAISVLPILLRSNLQQSENIHTET